MGRRDKTSNDRAVSRHFLPWLVRGGLVVSVAACNQIVGITEPTLLDGMGGAGGDVATSSSSGSTSGSGTGSSSGSSSVSSSASSTAGGMPCQNSGDCPNDTPCTNWSCTMAACVPMFKPQGTAVNDPTNGDCKNDVCDGMGNTMAVTDNNDTPPGDGNPCTIEACNNGTPTATFAPAGTNCGTGTCNGSGACGTCTNNMMDGDEIGVDCGGSVCKKCNGSACAMGTECKSSFCADGVCCDNACTGTCKSCNVVATVGTCANIPAGSTDDAPVCNGTNVCNGNGSCKLKNGEMCIADADCVSGKCVSNMGIKVCMP